MQSALDKATESKNNHGYYNGYAPAQWFHGVRHPLISSDEVNPSLMKGTDYELHILRRVAADKASTKQRRRPY